MREETPAYRTHTGSRGARARRPGATGHAELGYSMQKFEVFDVTPSTSA
jgi:hypothetical protein